MYTKFVWNGIYCSKQDDIFPTSIPKTPKEQGFLVYLKCLEELDNDVINMAKRTQDLGQPFL